MMICYHFNSSQGIKDRLTYLDQESLVTNKNELVGLLGGGADDRMVGRLGERTGGRTGGQTGIGTYMHRCIHIYIYICIYIYW